MLGVPQGVTRLGGFAEHAHYRSMIYESAPARVTIHEANVAVVALSQTRRAEVRPFYVFSALQVHQVHQVREKQ